VNAEPRQRALDDVLESLTQVWTQIRDRRVGITQDEYEWDPAPGSSGVVTTIKWREWHIGSDCLDSYSSRLEGAAQPVPFDEWPQDVDESWRAMERAYETFRGVFVAGGAEGLFLALGDAWGPYAQDTRLALALHALHEVAHHGAEIALLRDLYAAR